MKKIELAIIKAGQGLSIISDWANHAADIFCDNKHTDYLIRCALHLTELKVVAETEDQIFSPEMDSILLLFKDNLRSLLQIAINRQERANDKEVARKEKYNKFEASQKFKSMSKPAEEGTVAEIAKRYNKSLSEVRKLKRDGLLHTLAESN